jgi:hypothetical protein
MLNSDLWTSPLTRLAAQRGCGDLSPQERGEVLFAAIS